MGPPFAPPSSTHAAVVGAGSYQAALDALDRPPAQPGERQYKGYTERELRRDWTQPLGGDDGEAGRRS